MEEVVPPIANLTIIAYIFFPNVYLSSRPVMGPALDMGVERLRQVYNINATLRYVGAFEMTTYEELVDRTDMAFEFIERQWDRNGQLAFVTTGSEEQIAIGQMARGPLQLRHQTLDKVFLMKFLHKFPASTHRHNNKVLSYPVNVQGSYNLHLRAI